MSETFGILKNLGKSLKKDFSGLKDKTLSQVAKAQERIKAEGGIQSVTEKTLKSIAGDFGELSGRAGNKANAAFNSVSDTVEDLFNNRYDGKLTEVFSDLKARYSTHSKTQTFDPVYVRQQFENVASSGVDAMAKFKDQIRKGTDSISNVLKEYVPSESDYVMNVGSRKVEISRAKVFVKSDLNDVKSYITQVANALPSTYNKRGEVFNALAAEGVSSNKEFEQKFPELYATVSKYFTKKS
ncbi:MAG: hypothetical protein WC755_03040 [Candidatus Woesearchaeota archaeon]